MIIDILYRYGFVGLFLLAFISNAIPYLTIPYLIFVAPILSMYRGIELIVSIIALSLGAALGKVVVYFIGRGLASISKIGRRLESLHFFTSTYEKAVFLMVLAVAALPIPDDVFYIPVGLSRYSTLLFFIAVLLGKTIVTTLAAVYGVAMRFLLELTGMPLIVQVPLMVLVTLIITVIINNVNWQEAITIYQQKGVLEASRYILLSILVAVKALVKRILNSWFQVARGRKTAY